jgi:hypothetical protein
MSTDLEVTMTFDVPDPAEPLRFWHLADADEERSLSAWFTAGHWSVHDHIGACSVDKGTEVWNEVMAVIAESMVPGGAS